MRMGATVTGRDEKIHVQESCQVCPSIYHAKLARDVFVRFTYTHRTAQNGAGVDRTRAYTVTLKKVRGRTGQHRPQEHGTRIVYARRPYYG